jgi:hypothetical protein
MIPPFDRKRLQERNAIDDAEQCAEASRRSPAEGVAQGIELSDFVRLLAHATGANEATDRWSELEEKARLYTRPLWVLAGRV